MKNVNMHINICFTVQILSVLEVNSQRVIHRYNQLILHLNSLVEFTLWLLSRLCKKKELQEFAKLVLSLVFCQL